MIVRDINEAVDAIENNTARLLGTDEELFFVVAFDGVDILLSGTGTRDKLRSVRISEVIDEDIVCPFYAVELHKIGGEAFEISNCDDQLSEVVKDLRDKLQERFAKALGGGDTMGQA